MAGRDRGAEQARRMRAKLAELDAWWHAGTQQLATESGWRDWTTMAARFPQGEFDVANLVVIGQQHSRATALADYRGWQAMGRQVTKGERGIAIWSSSRDGEPVPRYVFDISQTHVPDDADTTHLTAAPRRDPATARHALADIAASHGVDDASRVVDDGAAAEQLAHRLSRVVHERHDDARPGEDDAAAHLVLAAHGLAPPRYTGPVPPGLTADTAQPAAARILATARALAPAHTQPADQERMRAQRAHGQRSLAEATTVADRAESTAALATPPGRVPDRAGGAVGERDPFPTSDRLDRLAALNRAAAAFYRDQFDAAPDVQSYLGQRVGDLDTTRARFVVGYAPAGWTPLLDHLRAQGHADHDLVDAGLVQRTAKGTLIDRFRDRILIGLHDEQGRLAGFIGRDHANQTGDGIPKYLNTPATELFDKSRVLLGVAEQHADLAAGAAPVACEGPFDVLALATVPGNHGQLAPVASSGTALTAEQVALLAEASRAERVVLGYDADPAGRAATLRAADLLAPLGRDVRVAALADGHDPASWVCAHPDPREALAAFLDDTRTRPAVAVAVDERIDRFGEQLQWVDGRVAAMRHAVAALDGHPASVVTEQALCIATRLEMDPVTVAEEIGETGKGDRAAARATRTRTEAPALARPHPASLARMASPTGPSTRAPRRGDTAPQRATRAPDHDRGR